MNKNINIPNILSVFRLLLIPVFAASYLGAETKEDYLFSAAVLLVSGLTDVLDGKIARRYNQITDLGKFLDPLADKLTQITACICVALRHPSLAVILAVLVIKEVLIFAGGVFIWRKQKFVVTSNIFGKVYTAVFYVLMFTVVAFPYTEPVLRYILIALLAVNICTFIKYAAEFISIRKNADSGELK